MSEIGGLSKIRLRRRGAPLLVVALVAILAAACSSNSSTTTTTSGSATSSTAQAAGTTVNIGLICSCNGSAGSSNVTEPGALEAWIKTTNAAGGIDGHHLNLIVEQDNFTPSTSLQDAEDLVNQDHVVGIVDAGVLDFTWEKFVQEHNIPVLGGDADNPTFGTNADFYPEGETGDAYPLSQFLALKAGGVKKMGLIYCTEAAICLQTGTVLKSYKDKLGIEEVATVAGSPSAPNFTAPCLAAKQAGATGLDLAEANTTVLEIVADCVAQGYTPVEEAGWSMTPSFLKLSSFNNAIMQMPDFPPFVYSTPASQAMLTALKKYDPSIIGSDLQNGAVVFSWVTGLMIGQALTNADVPPSATVTAADVIKGLDMFKGVTLGGLAPPLTFVAGQPTNVDCWFLAKISNGKVITPYGLNPTCVPHSEVENG